MTRSRRFLQLHVFTATAMRGNPLAVVVDGDGLMDREGRVYFHVSADDPKRLLIGGDVQQVIEGMVTAED